MNGRILDHDVFGWKPSKGTNVIDSNMREHDVVRKPVPTFRHHALERFRAWLWPSSRRVASLSNAPAAMLPDGLRIYAIGDIHGEIGLLDRMAGLIEADVAQHRPDRALAVFLGDYIDRGPDSRGVVERLAAGDFPIPFEALRGNHEDMMLQALADPDVLRPWLQTGGLATLRSYGLDTDKPHRGKSLSKLRQAFLDSLPPRHVDFLGATKLSLTVGDYFFVHAGARPGVPLDRQQEQDLLWIRDECYASTFDFGKVLVHGHTPCRYPDSQPRRINVDTGAFKWGVLSAAVLEGNDRRFLSADVATRSE